MLASRPTADGPKTEEEFAANLRWLIRAGRDNGVDVTGGWMDRTGDADHPDCGVEIHTVVDSGSDDESGGSSTQ